MITKPMLAGKCEDISALNWKDGFLCTPKIDGIRCLKINGKVLSRKFKDIPNKYVNKQLSTLPDGLDGELICPGLTFNETQSKIMTEEGEPRFNYLIFDYVENSLTTPYSTRVKQLSMLTLPVFCRPLLPQLALTADALTKYEEFCLANNHEGVMIRHINSPYKCGRSTTKEAYLLKLKRFEDSEAVVLSLEEKMHNNNEAKKDAFGRTERSSHKENLIPAGTLGTLVVKDIKSGVEFRIGTGLDDDLRKEIWTNKHLCVGKVLTYTFQPSGTKDKPRFPVFKGFRHEDDF